MRKIDVSSMHERGSSKNAPLSVNGLDPAHSQMGLFFYILFIILYKRKRSRKRQPATRRGHVVCEKSARGQTEHATIKNNNHKNYLIKNKNKK